MTNTEKIDKLWIESTLKLQEEGYLDGLPIVTKMVYEDFGEDINNTNSSRAT